MMAGSPGDLGSPPVPGSRTFLGVFLDLARDAHTHTFQDRRDEPEALTRLTRNVPHLQSVLRNPL